MILAEPLNTTLAAYTCRCVFESIPLRHCPVASSQIAEYFHCNAATQACFGRPTVGHSTASIDFTHVGEAWNAASLSGKGPQPGPQRGLPGQGPSRLHTHTHNDRRGKGGGGR